MADEETPRTLIQGFLRTAETNQGIILQRKRKSVARTPKALPSRDRGNQSYPGSLSSSKKQRLAQQELVTPRHLIESYVASTKTSIDANKRTKKRRSSLALMRSFDPIIDNFTPRTNIAGFLEQAPEETPIERELKRRSSNLPAIPTNKSIHLSHDFSSNVDYEHEVSVNSARRRSIRKSLANKTTVQQFKKGVQHGNDTFSTSALSPGDNIGKQIPDIPFNRSIHIDFSDIEGDESDINSPSQRPVRKRTKNRTNYQQFSQELKQKGTELYRDTSRKEYRRGDSDDDDDDNSPGEEEEDGIMADLSGNESSGESGVSGVSPRKSCNRSLQLSRLSQNNAPNEVSVNEFSPVIANQSVTKALRKSLQNSANRRLSETMDLQQRNTSRTMDSFMRKNLESPLNNKNVDSSIDIIGRSRKSVSKNNVEKEFVSPSTGKSSPRTRNSLINHTHHEEQVSLSTPKSSQKVSQRNSSYMSSESKDRSRTVTPKSSQRNLTNLSVRDVYDGQLSGPGIEASFGQNETNSSAVSPSKSSRLSQSRQSPRVMDKSKRQSVTGQSPSVMDKSKRHSVTGQSPSVMDKSKRHSVTGQSPSVMEQASKSSRLSQSRQSPHIMEISARRSVTGQSSSVMEKSSGRQSLSRQSLSVIEKSAESPRKSFSGMSPKLNEKSRRSINEVLMSQTRKSTEGFSPLASKVMRNSVLRANMTGNDELLQPSMGEFSPKLSSTRMSIAVGDKQAIKSRVSLANRSLQKSLNETNYDETRGYTSRYSAAGDVEAEEVIGNSEDEEEDQDTTELDNTDDKYRLITPHLQPQGNRPSIQLSEHRSPLRESSINRPTAPAAKVKKVPSKSHSSRQDKGDKLSMPASTYKKVFTHFCKRKVAKDALTEINKISEWFWKQIATDLESYALHAGRKIIDETDVELLMKRQRFITDKLPLNILVEKLLPLELRQEIIPMATSGNKVVPL